MNKHILFYFPSNTFAKHVVSLINIVINSPSQNGAIRASAWDLDYPFNERKLKLNLSCFYSF